MSETEGHPAKPPRFPFVGALLCAACVGTAAWLWMRYSYRWDMTADYLRESPADAGKGRWPDHAYVRLHGVMLGDAAMVYLLAGSGRPQTGDPQVFKVGPPRPGPGSNFGLAVTILPAMVPGGGEAKEFTGRVSLQRARAWGPLQSRLEHASSQFNVDTTRSRFTGESVAGLVVGVMGVFVFTVALRHWLRERRAVIAQEAS